MASRPDTDAHADLEQRLMSLEGVLHAAIDARSGVDVWVVRDPNHAKGPIELAVRNQLAALGHDPASFEVRVTLPTTPGPRRRVRFEGVERVEDAGRVSITVLLEWEGETYTGEAVGERGPAIELKTTAAAAIEALERLSDESLQARIIGVKAIHVFDSDLMVASLFRSTGTPQRLVGAVVVREGQDPLAAAAVAVMSALNRTLGNFLHTSD